MVIPIELQKEHSNSISNQATDRHSNAMNAAHRQLVVFSSLARIFYQAQSIESTVVRIMEEVAPLLGANAGAFWLLRGNEQAFHCVATWHNGKEHGQSIVQTLAGGTLPTNTGARQIAIETDALVAIDADEIASHYAPLEFNVQHGIQSICVVPVCSPTRAIGVYEFFCSTSCSEIESWMDAVLEAGRQTALWIERMDMEQDLRAAVERERQNNELKTRFMAVMSHDFRTPLTAILSSADLLEYLADKLSAEERAEYLGFIREAVERMTTLLDHVRFIRKVEEKQIVFYPTHVDISLFCDNLVQEMQKHDNGQHNLQYTVQGNGEKIRVDEKLLWEISTHLLSNAFKYSLAGADVVLRVVYTDTELVIEIQDNGIGIPKGEQNKLFTPFFRAANVGTIAGAGLGLFIVKHAVTLHGGVIHVVSDQGEGAVVTVQLPLIY